MTLVRGIVFQKNRRPKKVWVKPHEKKFTTSKTEEDYIIDPNRAVFDTVRPWFRLFKKYECQKYYYAQGYPKPIDPYNVTANGRQKESDLTVPSGEMRQIFNPIFYQIIAKLQKNKKEDIILMASITSAILSLYIIYQLSQLQSAVGM